MRSYIRLILALTALTHFACATHHNEKKASNNSAYDNAVTFRHAYESTHAILSYEAQDSLPFDLRPKKGATTTEIEAQSLAYYNEVLTRMNESPIGSYGQEYDVYFRFLWLRTFNRPVLVSLYKAGSGYHLYYKTLSGQSGYDPGSLEVSQEKPASANDMAYILSLAAAKDYWNLSTSDKNIWGFDGARWILEAKVKDVYHIVDRWSNDQGSLQEVCKALFFLTGVKLEPREIY